MPALTVHLSDETHEALRSRAESAGVAIDTVLEEIIRRAGLLASRDVTRWVREARESASLTDEEALDLAVAETRAARREQQKNRS